MKYLVIVAIALINFVLQADAVPSGDAVALSSVSIAQNRDSQLSLAVPMKPEASNRITTEQTLVANESPIGLPAVELGSNEKQAKILPGFVWIFGSMAAGAAALLFGHFFATNKPN